MPVASNRITAGLLAGALASVGAPLVATTATVALGVATAAPASAAQAPPAHSRLVPDVPRTNTPRIGSGEIWDIEVVPQLDRVFIAGTFTSLQNTTGTTTLVNQPSLASYNMTTGLIDTSFRPTFNGAVAAVEASPDGTKLFVAGSFNTVGGVTRQKVASLDLTTGAPVAGFAFAGNTNNATTALAVTNSTVYVGGRFTKINGQLRTGLAAVNASTGAVDMGFDNSISGGIGVNGTLTVQQLKLTHDDSKLLVVHTGRQIHGQDRYGMGIIDTATKNLLPWRSTLWDDNLSFVGGVTRVYAADIAPDDSYFVVTSGSGGDRPPISDTAVAYPLTSASVTSSDVKPLWISRMFDSVYSVAITEQAVYVGGHFSWNESPTANQPWPGLDNVGYGTGQGLSGYGLGDQVVRRDHIGALDPATGTAVEWDPGSNSFEGNKAMEATAKGLFVGGDGLWQGGVKTGRVAFYDFSTLPASPALPDTTITAPIEGRVVGSGVPFTITGSAKVASGSINRVQVEIQNRDTMRYLQDDGVTWGTSNSINATLGGGTTTRSWSLPATITGNNNLQIMAKTVATGGASDSTKALKKIESFGTTDQTPTTTITGPTGGVLTSMTFTMTGTASDDKGVSSLSYWFRDDQNRYLQDDGTVQATFNSLRGTPDVIGATSATWSYEVTLPHEGLWHGSATATDTAGQADLRSDTRDWILSSTGIAPSVSVEQPVAMTPPFSVPAVVVEPGGRMTFSGTASDDEGLKDVEVTLKNTTTRENLGADGTWGTSVLAGYYRISPVNVSGSTYNWTYTTPFTLTPGSYSFTVRATDDIGLTTASANQGKLSINAQVAGDLPPDTAFAFTAPIDESLSFTLNGTASDDLGVASVRIALLDKDTNRYLQPNGTMAATFATVNASLTSPNATSTTWTLPVTLPTSGNWSMTAWAWDTGGQQDPSTTGATATYLAYPNDNAPLLSATLGQPQSGATFSDGRIVVTGRADDDISIARVDVGIVNSVGQYMSSTGTFTSTTPSYRTAFLNSPGSVGSSYSYTTPVIPAGTYRVEVRAVDNHGQIGETRTATGVVVTQPSNQPPVASFTYSCSENVCTFDGRGSTDENTSTLTYSWNFGTGQGTASGSLPKKTFTAPGTFAVALTVKDEWTLTSVTTQSVTVVEPSGNAAPVPTFARSCSGLTCSVSSTGTTDPNPGDVISYAWSWGDGTAAVTGAAPPAHVYATAGTYTITMTATDGWGKAASTTRDVVLSEPSTNSAPTATFTAGCSSYTTCTANSAGTSDPDADAITYSWNWGDSTAVSTTANPSHTYALPGTYTVVLTVRDVWGKTGTATHDVTITEPAGNTGPTATFTPSCTTLTCLMDSTGTVDPDGHTIRGYLWDWGDGTVVSTGAAPSHTYALPGSYTITMTATDSWGRAGAPVTRQVTMTEPSGNTAPTITFSTSCTSRTCAVNSTGTADPDGIRSYSWNWGDGTAASTGAAPAPHPYTAAGSYTITVTVTDNWGRAGTFTRQVTLA